MHNASIVPSSPMRLLALSSVVAALLGQPLHASDIVGKWEGKWQQCDQCGPACATVCKTDCNRYRITISGTKHHIVPFLHDVKFCVVGQVGDRVILEGKSTLGFVTFRASASCRDMMIDYCSHHHTGRYCLTRCGCSGPPPVAYGPPPVAYAPPPYATPGGPPPAYRVPIAPPPPTSGF